MEKNESRFGDIYRQAIAFRNKRDWAQFHDPKNLAEAIVIEAAELLETFLWKDVKGSRKVCLKKRQALKEEMADILIYLMYMSKSCSIDLLAAAKEKLNINARKYPLALSRGSSKKYSEL